MTGDTLLLDGIEFIIVWNGEEGLIPDRITRVSDTWIAPRRMYNKTGKYSAKTIDNPATVSEDMIMQITEGPLLMNLEHDNG